MRRVRRGDRRRALFRAYLTSARRLAIELGDPAAASIDALLTWVAP